jgi:hypothetical protein
MQAGSVKMGLPALGPADEIAGGGHGQDGAGEFDVRGARRPSIEKSNTRMQLISFVRWIEGS